MFYHLQRQRLEQVLPGLLEKCLARHWRVVVQTGSEERCAALDTHLWTYRDDAFLPHGTERDGDAASQPIYLTTGEGNPNAANVRIIVDAADPGDLSGYTRAVYLFEGDDGDAVAEARRRWRQLRDAGHDVTYWQQNERGRWEKRA